MVVGLTGGIGSGKTTALEMFQEKGVSCYVADIEAKKLMNSSSKIRKKIKKTFGKKAYTSKKLNRAYIAEIVFNNTDMLKTLNNIVHPKVDKHFRKFVKKSEGLYVVYESAILFQGDYKEKFDYTITVTAPLKVRIQRVVTRDNSDEKTVLSRIQHQMSEQEMISKSDFVIQNINLNDTQNEVNRIHKILTSIL